ncbi:MAG: hypothetical protein CMN87_16460 [Stappia sp.]|uniref:hypothetical protein n=1 Tax=Stappia sp. TaxID=1870903 RepID=UPI000C4FD870|nr:hypothetical protein [Stappia sp.]MAA98855.1 hypothetical protein [Stappia sp.]MBM21599.1 hypothetical protein [Stappia sp.]
MMKTKTFFAAVLIGATLSAPAAQALDSRVGQAGRAATPAATTTATADVQLVGGRHWRGGRHWGGHRYERLRPRQIKRRLARHGFRHMRGMRMRGDVYVLQARGPRGVKQRLVVDAYSGRVVGRTVIGGRWGGRWGHGPRRWH